MIGSTQRLKKKLGTGFILEMNMQPDEKQAPVKDYLKKLFPNAEENERLGAYISFRIPRAHVTSLGRVFEKLEACTSVQRALCFDVELVFKQERMIFRNYDGIIWLIDVRTAYKALEDRALWMQIAHRLASMNTRSVR